jgi:hypothetical protein
VQQAGRFVSLGDGPPVAVPSRSTARIARQEPAAAEAPEQKPADLSIGQFVDLFEEIYYDPSYRPDQPGYLSNWLRVKYADGTWIEININELSETTMPLAEAGRAMADAAIGRGNRIFPSVLNATTTPRLLAARRSALEIMAQHDFEIEMISTGVAMFLITSGAPLTTLGPAGAPPLPSSSWRRVDRPRVPVPAATVAQSVAEVSDEIFMATAAIKANGPRFIKAAGMLSSKQGLTALQKVQVIQSFATRIGFGFRHEMVEPS